MKPELLQSLRCIHCNNTEFDISITDFRENLWNKGTITCRHCSRAYLIRDGVLDTLTDLSPHLQQEYGAFLQHHASTTIAKLPQKDKDRFVLDLPESLSDPYTSISFLETLHHMIPVSGIRVLDLGSGLSWTTREFARQGAYAVAYDLIDYQLFSAGIYFDGTTYFERIRGDMETLPFADTTFDMVFSRASIHHSQNLALVFREISRVLVPGGSVFLSQEPVFGFFQGTAMKQFGMDGKRMGSTENCYTAYEWKTGMETAGLKPRFIFMGGGLREKFYQYRQQNRYTGGFWTFLARILEIPSLLKLLKICYISPLYYIFPLNLLITGEKVSNQAG